MREFEVDVSWKIWLMMLDSARNKHYAIWSYKTPNMDKTL